MYFSITDVQEKEKYEKRLLCDIVDNFRKPSICAGKTRSCRISDNDGARDAHKSADDVNHKDSHDGCGSVCYIGIAAGCAGVVLLLAVVAVIVKKKKAAGRRLLT